MRAEPRQDSGSAPPAEGSTPLHEHVWRTVAHDDGCHWHLTVLACECGAAREEWHERDAADPFTGEWTRADCEGCRRIRGAVWQNKGPKRFVLGPETQEELDNLLAAGDLPGIDKLFERDVHPLDLADNLARVQRHLRYATTRSEGASGSVATPKDGRSGGGR